MGLLDRLLGRTAPPDLTTRRFDATGGRRWASHPPAFGRVGPETLAAGPSLRAKARHAYANDPWIRNGVNALVAGLVGTGVTPASADPAINAAIGAWAKSADADGRTDLYGLQAEVARALVIDGEAFLHLGDDLRIRHLPAEMIDESDTRELPGGGYRVAGIEFDASGARVAYSVFPARATDVYATVGAPMRVPAREILHVMAPLGPGQVRGVSWLAPVLLRASELDQLEDALLTGAKTSAMFAGFLTDENGTADGSPFDGATDGSVMTAGLEPGTLQYLPSGWKLTFSTPQQAQQTDAFVRHQLRAIAAGLGVPAHLVSGDLSDANYGSLRAGMVTFRQRLEQVQFGTLIPQMCEPLFQWAAAGLGFEGAAAAEHYPPPMPWIDPAKDAAAIRERLSLGLMSRRQAVAELGFNIEALDAEIAADRAREAALGLVFGKDRP